MTSGRRTAAFTSGLLWVFWFGVGCQRPQTIVVDYSTTPIRFIIDHVGWPRPFKSPRVTEFAIADDQDGVVWEIRSTDDTGLPAVGLAIVYGEKPPGFVQVHPENNAPPKALQTGRTFYVAAGGPKHVYRMVFALPLDALEIGGGRRVTSRPGTHD